MCQRGKDELCIKNKDSLRLWPTWTYHRTVPIQYDRHHDDGPFRPPWLQWKSRYRAGFCILHIDTAPTVHVGTRVDSVDLPWVRESDRTPKYSRRENQPDVGRATQTRGVRSRPLQWRAFLTPHAGSCAELHALRSLYAARETYRKNR